MIRFSYVFVGVTVLISSSMASLIFNDWLVLKQNDATNWDSSFFPFFKINKFKSCGTNYDCLNAFSECDPVTKFCKCKDGFSKMADSFSCFPDNLYCPSEIVNGLEKIVNPGLLCKVDKNNPMNNTCNGGFCFVYSGMQVDSVYSVGHCCFNAAPGNRLTLACPLTPYLYEKVCLDGTGDSTNHRDDSCPTDSFDCVSIPTKQAKICCPKACQGNFIAIHGTCLERKEKGQICQNSAQCPTNTNCLMSADNVLKCM